MYVLHVLWLCTGLPQPPLPRYTERPKSHKREDRVRDAMHALVGLRALHTYMHEGTIVCSNIVSIMVCSSHVQFWRMSNTLSYHVYTCCCFVHTVYFLIHNVFSTARQWLYCPSWWRYTYVRNDNTNVNWQSFKDGCHVYSYKTCIISSIAHAQFAKSLHFSAFHYVKYIIIIMLT